MPRKSSKRDKAEGALGVIKGRIKEAIAALRGDTGKKVEGHLDKMKGGTKWAKGRMKGFLK